MTRPSRFHGAVREEGFRPEIQALRALAVATIVMYHSWPHLLPGGYVGVDVFFVISGFLITSHLLREWRGGARISVSAFWARRARRLLPASLLVLAVVALATPFLIPASQWQQVFKEIAASALYVENWVLAADSVDYLAAGSAPTPVQHFWSLSVEEQFYLAWPLLLVAAAAVTRTRPERRRAVAVIFLTVIVVASLAYSVATTFTDPGPAYFVTPARAWEFGAGGLLAFVGVLRLAPSIRALLAWTGWFAIVGAAVLFSPTTPFPGIAAALPVLGTLAVIGAGRSPVPWASDRLFAIRPLVFLGDISYSTYLWHWPALIFGAAALDERFTWPAKVVAIGVVVLVAWLTTRLVENPVRRARVLLTRRARFTLLGAVLAMAIVAVPSGVAWSSIRAAAAAEVAAAEFAAEQHIACFGAGFRDPGRDCTGVTYHELTPDPSAAIDDKARAYEAACITGDAKTDVRECEIGDADGDFRVALIGDSHIIQWEPALALIAEERGWEMTTLYKSLCPHSTAEKVHAKPEVQASCGVWNAVVSETITELAPFDLVFVSYSARRTIYPSNEEAIEGFREAWRQFIDRGAEVVVLADVPGMLEDTTACLEDHELNPDECAVPIADSAQSLDLMVEAAAGEPHVSVIDLTDYFCWEGTCKAAIGGVVAYRDTHHITKTLAITFTPFLARELDALALGTAP